MQITKASYGGSSRMRGRRKYGWYANFLDKVDPRACGVDGHSTRAHRNMRAVDPRACGVDTIVAVT